MKTLATVRLSSKILLFSIRSISASPYECLLEKYEFQVDQNVLELFFVSRLSKKIFLQQLFSLTIILHCFSYSVLSFFNFDLMAFFFNWERFIITERSVSLLWGFWLFKKIIFFGGCLPKTSRKLSFKEQYSPELCKFVNFLKSLYMSVFGTSFWNVAYSVEYMKVWWSLKSVSTRFKQAFVIR